MPGELVGDRVVVRQQSEASRIHNKGHYGRPLSGGGLQLDLLESTYLVEIDRLQVNGEAQRLSFPELVIEATRRHPGFEILYLVYRDLRERGYLVRAYAPPGGGEEIIFHTWPRGTERGGLPTGWVKAVSERSQFSFRQFHGFVAASAAAKCIPRLAVVDEESDLTYYDLSAEAPAGSTAAHHSGSAEGVLLADRVLVPETKDAKEVHEREFYGRLVAGRLQLSLVESGYLVDAGRLKLTDAATGKPLSSAALRRRGREIEPQLDTRLRVYADLKQRGLIVKTGFKFGTHFRAYEKGPNEGHAPFLIQAVPADFESGWEPLARAIRLSHSVRKKFLLAAAGTSRVDYLAFGRYRP